MNNKTNNNNNNLPNINIKPKFTYLYEDLIPSLKYIYNYYKGSFDALFNISNESINLSNENVERITKDSKNVKTILTNEFLENNNNTIRKAKNFKNTIDTLLGDKKIPLSKISTYYGIENNKLKAGDLEIFNDETIVIPNRSKNVGKIKKIIKGNVPNKIYKERLINDVDSVAKIYNDSLGYKPKWYNYISAFAGGLTPRAIYMDNAGIKNLNKLYNDLQIKNTNKYIDPNYKPNRFITENGDTIPATDLNATPKVLFANEQGNSAFFTNPYNNLDKVNKFLNKNPSYPIMVDNGRYAFYQTNYPNIESYAGLANPDDMFILGTTNKKQYGGMAKQLYPNIVRGGMAIPLGNNYYFMKGRKHTQGGIDVGKDLEVEGGEIMKLDKNNIKVFSAVPFLNGRSPVEKILGGENPNKVFAQQERFKKVNKINDDGTKAKYGKRKINTKTIPESEQYTVTTPNGQRKVFNNKEEVQQYITANTPKGYSLYDTTNYGSNIDKGQTAILNRNTEREIEKATEEEIKTNARKANIESNKEYAMEALNAMPIIGDGMDIYSIVKDTYNKNYGNAALTAGMMVFPFDKLLKPVGKGIKKLYTNITDRLNTNTNLIDLNTNLFNDKKLEEPTLFIEDDGKVKEVFPTSVYENNLPNLNFDNNELNKIDNYFKNIYLKKYLKNRNVNIDDINPTKPINNSTISTDLGKIVHTNPDEIEYLKETGGGFSENGIAYLDDSYKTMLPPTHEIRHNHRDSNLESQDFFKNGEEFATRLDGGTYKYPISEKYYTKKEVDLVQNGYMFPKGFESKMSEHQVLAEKANLNSDIQLYLVNKYNLQDDTQLVSKIEELSDEDLFSLLSEVNSPYAKKATSALRILRPNKDTYDAVLNNMKEALKYVPATIGVGAGLSLINNNENNQYKYGGKMNRQKAPFGILKNLGEIFGFSKKDDKPKETSKTKKTNKPISKIYIGGKPNEARQKYYDLDTEFADSVKAVSKRYGLNPNLVASRLAKEGPVDHNIKLSNDGYRFIRDVVFGPQWGLDDLGNHIKEGKVNIKESWNNIDVDDSFVNEKGRLTNTVYSPNWVDGIYGTAAELKYRRDYMKKHFPKMTEEQLDAAAAASFNRGNAGARKWINRGGNYMQYKPFIKLKQLGGKANIYRLDSNGKSGLRMNISTGDETKARKKALLGTGYEIINNKLHYYGVPVNEINKTYQPPELTLNNFNNKYKDNYEFTDKGLEYKPYRSNVLNVPKLNFNVKHDNKKTINWNKIGTAIKPYAGSIIDTVGNIATSLINASTLNKMKYTKQPIPQIANKFKTSVNINPQLKTLNESYNQYTDYINNNTASSKVAREALQRARIKNVLDTNTLYATKENAETELINKDRINQQTVANANVDNYNKWLAGKAEFDNAILDKKSENIVGAINNITSSFNTSINNIKKDRQFNNNLISVLAANPNVNPEYLRALGADWVTDKMIEDWKLANKKK